MREDGVASVATSKKTGILQQKSTRMALFTRDCEFDAVRDIIHVKRMDGERADCQEIAGTAEGNKKELSGSRRNRCKERTLVGSDFEIGVEEKTCITFPYILTRRLRCICRS